MSNASEKIFRTFVLIVILAIILLLVGATTRAPIDAGGQSISLPLQDKQDKQDQQVVTPGPDERSTTGPEPPGGPHGAVAEAGLGFTPGPNSHVIEHVPAYIWFNGCGPTSGAMILGYWNWLERSKGYDWVMPGDSSEQTQMVNDVIASPQHIADYALPHDDETTGLRLDKSEPPFGNAHVNNSLADDMSTSFSSRGNFWGWSWFSDVSKAFEGYLGRANPGDFSVQTYNIRMNDSTLNFEVFKSFIDRDIPVMLLVDSNGDGQTDHFVPAYGYDVEYDANGQEVDYYAARNTWDYLVHWYRWQPMAPKAPYGVYGATVLIIKPVQPVFTLTFTPSLSLRPTVTPENTLQAQTPTWTQIRTPTLHPAMTATPGPTPGPAPAKADTIFIVVFMLVYLLASSATLLFAFIKIWRDADNQIDKKGE